MVIKVDKKTLSVVISCQAVPDYMDAMKMAFKVRDSMVLNGLNAGTTIQFTMVEDGAEIFAEHIRVVKNLNGEAEPMEAARSGFCTACLIPRR